MKKTPLKRKSKTDLANRDSKGRYIKGGVTRARTSIEVACILCGNLFFVQPHRFKTGRGKFCSLRCKQIGIFTKEVRDKMSNAKKGKPAPYRQKEKCHFWKGGVTKINVAIRMSLEYRLWREAVFKRDGYTCIWCGVVRTGIQADHIKSFAHYPELRFAIDNGRTLCETCHKTTDNYGGKNNKKGEKN